MKVMRTASPRTKLGTGPRRPSSSLSRARVRKSGRNYRAELRAEMIAAYGGKCECPHCGIAIAAFLTLEHKAKDGAAHRARVGKNAQAQLLDLKRRGWPSGEYGLLCFNCNIGAGTGTCPHVALYAHLNRELAETS